MVRDSARELLVMAAAYAEGHNNSSFRERSGLLLDDSPPLFFLCSDDRFWFTPVS
jgi:hypothetical protein